MNKTRFLLSNGTMKQKHFPCAKSIMEMLGNGGTSSVIETIPFSLNDTTSGAENEFQAVVEGNKNNVDLPLIIEGSGYYRNIQKRIKSGETSGKAIADIERFLNDNTKNIWESSWVRFPRRTLTHFANTIFMNDLMTDKNKPDISLRSDFHKFLFLERNEEMIRIPVSYLLKLALADVIGCRKNNSNFVVKTGNRLLRHFLNDNISPEIVSFNVVPVRIENGMGESLARETAKRFLLTQLLVMYANDKFLLKERGQNVKIYLSTLPPLSHKLLNESVSDSFYRELFMNPCLSGWDNGESKLHYMHLCHQVLSRSQLNAIAKLREAGILTNNLVSLPNTSNISLANNGTHISLGSIKLTGYLQDKSSGFNSVHEKYLGDLVIKIVEHFLPLFAGNYSAAPYRLDFAEFRPETSLGFLPHELDYTHLRMIWRRWRKKANVKFSGIPFSPCGTAWINKFMSVLFRLKGDYLPDFRLINYFVALMSTHQSPGLNGAPGNSDALKKDLAELGIFDAGMSMYLPYKLREFNKMGYSGFEGRFYSVFETFENDMGNAVSLQTLLTALAFKYIVNGKVTHMHIPDNPFTESERRQIFFCAAIGIPTFYVREDTGNLFLKRVIAITKRVRRSHRYPGYLRIYLNEYYKALVELLRNDAADLIEMFQVKKVIDDLALRVKSPENYSAAARLTKGVLKSINANTPFDVNAHEFNIGTEKYYREYLRKRHMEEAFRMLEEDLATLSNQAENNDDAYGYRIELQRILSGKHMSEYFHSLKKDIMNEEVSVEDLKKLIHLVLLTTDFDAKQFRNLAQEKDSICL